MKRFLVIYISLFSLSLVAGPSKNTAGEAVTGFKLVAVKKNSIYERLGLKAGDVITRVNDTDIDSPEAANRLYETLKTEKSYEIYVMRDGEQMIIESPQQTKNK